MKKALISTICITCLTVVIHQTVFSQPVPTNEENIPYLVTFGGNSDKKWGDDDFCQIFFVSIPTDHISPIYIRIYDPDCGGDIDEPKGTWDTKTSFSVYGGKGCLTTQDAKNTDPDGNYKSGNLLSTKTFGESDKFNKEWYTFGPFNPTEGELVPDFGGYIFKIIAMGISGDDGNLYRYFISTDASQNKEIEGSNAFTYEYTFRMHDNAQNVSHIYPYVDDKVIFVKITNFDWDNDGIIRVISVAKNGVQAKVSTEGNWENATLSIVPEEKNTSLDIQFIKNKSNPLRNNNVVIFVTNQDKQGVPFYVSPIGGIPKFKGKIIATQKSK